jgi:hypothetical protein
VCHADLGANRFDRRADCDRHARHLVHQIGRLAQQIGRLAHQIGRLAHQIGRLAHEGTVEPVAA